MSSCSAGTGGGGSGGTNHGQAFRVTGSGKILGKTVSFEINVDDLPSGRLKYHDKEQNIDFASDRVTSFTRLATNKITFSGEATINGQTVMFTVEVEDNGAGTSDRIKITITGAANSMREGTLTQGNIQFHKWGDFDHETSCWKFVDIARVDSDGLRARNGCALA